MSQWLHGPAAPDRRCPRRPGRRGSSSRAVDAGQPHGRGWDDASGPPREGCGAISYAGCRCPAATARIRPAAETIANVREPEGPDARFNRQVATARSSRTVRHMPPTYTPPVVSNWDALHARLDEILGTGGKANSTLSGYRSALRWWQRFCQDAGVEPWAAPFDAWEKAVKDGRRVDGKRLGWDYYSLMERAVAREHHERLLPPPAPRQPQHAGAWTEIGRAYRSKLNLEWSMHREVYDRAPLLRDDITALLSVDIIDLPETSTAEHAGRAGSLRRVAERLVLLDTGCSANLLAKTGRDQIAIGGEGVSLTVDDEHFTLLHEHTPRVPGVPWDCAACAVVERVAEAKVEEPLFRASGIRQVADGRWPGLVPSSSRLLQLPSASARERAGLRRGLVLSAHRPKEWTWWLLGRAWIALSWEAGYRMAGDLATLDRSWCLPLPDGDGFRIQLHGTKDDPNGAKRVTRPFRFDPAGGPSAALMLTEYLAVRDARLGPTGPLLWWGGDPAKGRASIAAVRCITTLAAAAHVDKQLRSYSPRKGYSTQSAMDGHSPEMRQRGLRQVSLRTTLSHYPDADKSLASSDLLMRRLSEQLGAER